MPAFARHIIEARAEQAPFPALKQAAARLSDAYRAGNPTRLTGGNDLTAYLVTRMPATYAASRAVLDELPDLPFRSVLDIGAGPGAAALAARDRFADLTLFTLIERDPSLADAAAEFLPAAQVVPGDIESMREFPPHDLVIASYAIGELRAEVVARLWAAARMALIIIEPGTPHGARNIACWRSQLLECGAQIAAPCPGPVPCPLTEPDWCHFGARVERSSLHRKLKGGDLGYEDEKYSYIAVTRDAVPACWARVLRHPQHRPALIELQLCTSAGRTTERVTKRDRDRFRAARKAGWGSAFE